MMKDPRARANLSPRVAWAACLGIVVFLAQGGVANARGGFQRGFQHGGGRPAAHAGPRSQARLQARAAAPNRGQPNRMPPNPAQANRFQQVPGGRPAYNSAPYSMRATPQSQAGHLPQWLAQHQNMPVGQQERLLRAEPGFNRLNPVEQQREIQQLHRLDALPEAQRDRRMARAEAIERLSPEQRMQVNQSVRELNALPSDRQAMLHGAFRDLRGVPVDQRDTMLNSARYRATFSPQERGILSNLLRVEPYEPQR